MDSFKNRVDKAFGSLGMSSSWCLSDEQPRPKKEQQQQEQEEEEEDCRGAGRDGMDFEGDMEEESRQMRCMVGLDATLDFEEEEDEFDKAAFGFEGNEERLYMMGIKEVDKKLTTSASLPLSLYDLKKVRRDPRANHSAARARLEEDARGATAAAAALRDPESVVADVDQVMKTSSEPRIDDQQPPSEHLSNSQSEKAKSSKRVRFALDLEERGHQETNAQKVFIRSKGNSDHASKVPDHIRNPSKYTHYTLDWAVEDNDVSNMEAFKACNENLRNGLKEEHCSLQETPQKIQYIHRPGRATGIVQKSDMEVTNQSVMPVKRTMCIEHCETETQNAEIFSDDSMDSKSEESVSGFHMIVGKNSGKPAKNYRLKREAVDSMDI